MADYQEFLDGIDRAAYHEGEWQWEEDGYTVTRTYNYSAPGCHDSCGILAYTKDNRLVKVEGDPPARTASCACATSTFPRRRTIPTG